jgi:hypothetical protein
VHFEIRSKGLNGRARVPLCCELTGWNTIERQKNHCRIPFVERAEEEQKEVGLVVYGGKEGE